MDYRELLEDKELKIMYLHSARIYKLISLLMDNEKQDHIPKIKEKLDTTIIINFLIYQEKLIESLYKHLIDDKMNEVLPNKERG